MRLLHVADLHAGKTLRKVSRNPDLAYALDQIVQFAKENSPNLLLLAGDIFDKANPDNESKELVFDFFLRLKDLGVEVVLVSGNHDSYDFMKSIKRLSKLANVHIYDRPSREECVYLFGDLAIACLPYPSERVLTSASEDSKLSYAELVSQFIRYLASKVRDSRHRVLLAHLFVAGSKYTRTEKEATITQHYAINPVSLTEDFDYVALGHIHRHQRVEGAPTHAYYSGSLYQLDFSEAGNDKFFNFVILGEGVPKVEPIKLDLKNQLSVFDLRQSETLRRLPELRSQTGYLKLLLRVEDRTSLPTLLENLRRELGERLVIVELVEGGTGPASSEGDGFNLNPLELYREYYRITYGEEPPHDLEGKFLELLREAG